MCKSRDSVFKCQRHSRCALFQGWQHVRNCCFYLHDKGARAEDRADSDRDVLAGTLCWAKVAEATRLWLLSQSHHRRYIQRRNRNHKHRPDRRITDKSQTPDLTITQRKVVPPLAIPEPETRFYFRVVHCTFLALILTALIFPRKKQRLTFAFV